MTPNLMPLLWHVGRGVGIVPLTYLLRDEFTTPDANPLTSPRTCEPGPGTLTVVDTGGNLNISAGQVVFGGGGAAWTGMYDATDRAGAAGIAVMVDGKSNGSNRLYSGWNTPANVTALMHGSDDYGSTLFNLEVDNAAVGSGDKSTDFRKHLYPFRSVGVHFILDGKLLWVSDVDSFPALYAAFSTFGNGASAVVVQEAAEIDLPAQTRPDADGSTALWAKWDDDFSKVTDSESTPLTGAELDCDNNFHARCSFTYETGKLVYVQCRDSTYDVHCRALTDGGLRLYAVDPGFRLMQHVGGVFADGVAYDVDFVVEGLDAKIFVDNVLTASGTINTGYQDGTGCTLTHTLATNDIELETHPYPSLGIATDRVIAPQANGTFTHTDDYLMVIRGENIPAVGNQMYDSRNVGAVDYLRTFVGSDGSINVWEIMAGAPGFRISGGAATVSEGDDIVLVCDGSDCSLYVAGTQVGATATLTTITSGTSGDFFNQVVYCDSFELWPRDVTSLLPTELGGSV